MTNGVAPNELTATTTATGSRARRTTSTSAPASSAVPRVRRTRFDDWPCPIARTTDLIGDWWTPLVLRELFSGRRRFDDIQESLGIPRAVLAQRLDRLVDEGMVRKVAYEEHPPRYEYRLTDKGREFWDVLAAMWRWGSDWLWEDGRPAGRAEGPRDRPGGAARSSSTRPPASPSTSAPSAIGRAPPA